MDDGGPQILFADDGDFGGGDLPGLGATGGGQPAPLQDLPPPPGFSAPASAGTAAPVMPSGQPMMPPSHGSVPSMPVKLFFGQVPRVWSDLEVRDIFDKYGSISDFIVLKFKDTGNSKGKIVHSWGRWPRRDVWGAERPAPAALRSKLQHGPNPSRALPIATLPFARRMWLRHL